MDDYMPLCAQGHLKIREDWTQRKNGHWRCRECQRIYTRENAAKWTPEQRDAKLAHVRAYNLERRTAIINEYGHVCAWCGEADYIFLTLDHVNDDGAEHRREIGAGSILSWIEDNNYPDSIQLLCWNCNVTKDKYGEERVREAIEQRPKQRDNEPSGDARRSTRVSQLATTTTPTHSYRHGEYRIVLVGAKVRTADPVWRRVGGLGSLS